MAYINGNDVMFGTVLVIGGSQAVGESVILQNGEVGTSGEVTELEE